MEIMITWHAAGRSRGRQSGEESSHTSGCEVIINQTKKMRKITQHTGTTKSGENCGGNHFHFSECTHTGAKLQPTRSNIYHLWISPLVTLHAASITAVLLSMRYCTITSQLWHIIGLLTNTATRDLDSIVKVTTKWTYADHKYKTWTVMITFLYRFQ